MSRSHQPVDLQEARQLPRADDAAGGAGHRHMDRRRRGGLEGHLAAVGFDQCRAVGDAGGGQPLAHAGQPRGHFRLQIGIGDGGGRPLIFLPLGHHVAGEGNRHVRQFLAQDLGYAPFMAGIEKGEETGDGHRLAFALFLQPPRQRANAFLVERRDGVAIAVDPLVHLEAVAVLHQGIGLDPGDVVMAAPVAALDERHVAEAAGGDIGDGRAFSLQDHVGGDGGADAQMGDLLGIVDALQAVQDAVGGVFRRGQVFPGGHGAAGLIIGDEIGEGAADIDADDIASHAALPVPPDCCPESLAGAGGWSNGGV